MKRDYYEVLGVQRDADDQAIKRAYRQLAREFHPDRNPDNPEAEANFKEASEAYQVLSDARARARYDRAGHAAFSSDGPGGFDSSNVGDIFETLFNGFSKRRGKPRGPDLQVKLEVTFEEAALGTEKLVSIRRTAICHTCHGSGAKPGTPVRECQNCNGTGAVKSQRGFLGGTSPCPRCEGRGTVFDVPCSTCRGGGTEIRNEQIKVMVPPGVDNGAVQTLREYGQLGPGGSGDLHVTIVVAEHPLFVREGVDIHCFVPIGFPEAALGGEIEVPTLTGKVNMKLPPGTQSGKVFRLRGKGVSAYAGMGKGDQFVKVIVEVPQKLNRKQRRLVEELASEMGSDSMPQKQTFLGKLRELFD